MGELEVQEVEGVWVLSGHVGNVDLGSGHLNVFPVEIIAFIHRYLLNYEYVTVELILVRPRKAGAQLPARPRLTEPELRLLRKAFL
ncbi:hypothetical protein E2C01_040128 [Portunus trituberculatus]|uniref:Uncharacterized protein n=1 Tax=Portunus trituberculatus TaxID=210409 RepID=A0A5B7FN54_PORTR|nr:hypothetical protein [Portunus trituberculatus]